MAKMLGQFSITRETDGYLIRIEDEDGDIAEYEATLEQLDLIGDAIEEQIELEEDGGLPLDDDDDEADEDD
ncbi:hypothetical protein [Sphingomonas sp.]|uniref:hypothetical protein n=1 Tax=Sphingomonas sp. TaxID=28214 RepID=UPI002C3A76C5|nr:hypothetical protein [Sphingomonas sp.]HWK36298.1 hypothetical protein [Sphingomonas sp.]